MNMKKTKIFIWILAIYLAIKEAVDSALENRKVAVYAVWSDFKADTHARGMMGGLQVIMLLLGVVIASVFGLTMTPTIISACNSASWAFNGSDYEAIMDLIYVFGIPVGYACLFLFLMFGAGYGVYRVAVRL